MRILVLLSLIFSIPLSAQEKEGPLGCPVIEIDLGKFYQPVSNRFRQRAKELLNEIMFPPGNKPKPAWLGEFLRRTKQRPTVAPAEVQYRSQPHLDLATIQELFDKLIKDYAILEGYIRLVEEGSKETLVRHFQERIGKGEKGSDQDVPNFVLETELSTEPAKMGEVQGREEKFTFTLRASGGATAACLVVRGRSVL